MSKKAVFQNRKAAFMYKEGTRQKEKGGQKEENIHLKKRDRRMENDKKQKKMAQ